MCGIIKILKFLGSTIVFTRNIYNEVIKRTEKWTEWFNFFYVKLSLPGVVAPNLVITLFLYFTTDSGTDAFLLPFPVL